MLSKNGQWASKGLNASSGKKHPPQNVTGEKA